MKWIRLIAVFASLLVTRAIAQTNQTVYTDGLANGWNDWSWATVNFTNSSPVHNGTRSIAVTAGAWQALYLHHAAQDSSYFTNLTFWIHGGASGGQQLLVQATLSGNAGTNYNLPTLTTDWQQVTISLSDLGVADQSTFDGFWIQDRTGAAQAVFYVDDITLTGGTSPPPVTNSLVTITVDAARNQRPISDLIYGVAFATSNQLSDLNCPLNRSGGNSETRYNWQQNAHNHAADFFFESIADSSTNAPGLAADDFVAATKSAGAQSMLTVPTIGWVAKLGPGRGKLASYSIAKYGPQTGNDAQYLPDAGNGISVTNNTRITWNDPNDANVLTDSTFQQSWIQHVTNRWGTVTNGGVRYFIMDNEPSIWHSTHQDVHPVGATMREIRDKFFDYAAKVKAVDTNVLIAAPEEWGWSGYFYSGYDQQYGPAHNWSSFPDRSTNGGWDYLPWFLDQLHQRATKTNQRLLDVFTVHYYPQGGEYSSDISTSMQLRRNRSTRSLWDTNYTDETWISDVVKLVPRLKSWVSTYYPGTKVGVTEYSWGADNHINGATAQADVLGIFARENLDLATRWTVPDVNTPAYNAIKMFRNYDGKKSTFGSTNIYADTANPDNVSSFAAITTNQALTVIVINKQLAGIQPISIALSNFVSSGSAQQWQLNSSNVITRLPDVPISAAMLSNVVPAQSITLLVVPVAMPPHLRVSQTNATSNVGFWIDGQAGQTCVIEASSNLANWIQIQTNQLSSNSLYCTFSNTNGTKNFYRARLVP